MTLEQQVVSLDLAKRLKELGVKQESLFWYEQIKIAGKNEWKKEWELGFNNNSTPYHKGDRIVSAFTVAELGNILPAFVRQRNSGEMVNLQMQKLSEEEYVVSIMSRTDQVYGVHGKTEAEARGLMLAYLIENNLMSV